MNILRRKFIQGAAAMSAGLLASQRAMAAYLADAFEAKDVDGALNAVAGANAHETSDQVKLKAPDIAENGAVVPVTVSSTLPNVDSISVVVATNPSPLACTYMVPEGTQAFVSTRIKMGKTSDVVAVVRSNGKLYSATKEVKVTIGGCGG
ncbi:MAG: thiosulfate oxidation carrier protein SoxY [Pseudomonadota bacterium]